MRTKAVDPITVPATTQKVFDDLDLLEFKLNARAGAIHLILQRVNSATGEKGEVLTLSYDTSSEISDGLVNTLVGTVKAQGGKLQSLSYWRDNPSAEVTTAIANLEAGR